MSDVFVQSQGKEVPMGFVSGLLIYEYSRYTIHSDSKASTQASSAALPSPSSSATHVTLILCFSVEQVDPLQRAVPDEAVRSDSGRHPSDALTTVCQLPDTATVHSLTRCHHTSTQRHQTP